MALLTADKTYEGGKHPFPVMPKFVPHLIKYLVSRKYAGTWKFGSYDYWGQPVHAVHEYTRGEEGACGG
jgi:hypothetical protein